MILIPNRTFRSIASTCALAVASVVAHAAPEPAIPRRSAALSVQADDADSRDLTAVLILPMNRHAWTQLQAGSTRTNLDEGSTDTIFGSARIGVRSGSLQSQVGFAYRADSDALKLQDFLGALTYLGSRGSIGIDLFYRKAEDETIVSRERRFGNPRAVVVTESFDGRGFGLHSEFDISARWLVFASGMKYDYDETSNLQAALNYERLTLSGVTREAALLDDTLNVGATLKLQPLWLTLSYIRDRAFDTLDVTQTTELAADIPVSERWSIAPLIGYSASDTQDSIGYAGVNWRIDW